MLPSITFVNPTTPSTSSSAEQLRKQFEEKFEQLMLQMPSYI